MYRIGRGGDRAARSKAAVRALVGSMTLIYQLLPRDRQAMAVSLGGGSAHETGGTEPRHIKLFAFVASINDVYLVATFIALAALPLGLWVRRSPVVREPPVESTVGARES